MNNKPTVRLKILHFKLNFILKHFLLYKLKKFYQIPLKVKEILQNSFKS